MTGRSKLIVGLFVGLSWIPAVMGQYPPGTIPPTPVPLRESPEPDFADPRKPQDLPDKLRPEILTPKGSPAPLTSTGTSIGSQGDPPTPSVSIHVGAPSQVAIGSPLVYTITVENRSQASAHHVKVTNPLNANLQFNKADPTPDEHTPALLTWKLGTLKPGDSRTIKLELAFKGDAADAVENVSRVSFEHGQKVRTALQRPKLTVKKLANQFAVENQPMTCRLVVENNGPLDVVNVSVHESLGDGLEFAGGDPAKKKVQVWTFDRIKAGGKQELTYAVIATKAGELTSTIEASGERGVIAKETWRVHAGQPPLKLEITGPDKVYLNYDANYQIKLQNSGTAALDNVAVAFSLVQGMQVMRASQGGQNFKDRVQWSVGELRAGDTRIFNITVRAKNSGRVPNIVTVYWRGPEQRASKETDFMGATALQLSLRESKDPVAVGEKVVYTLIVHNRGTSPATGVQLLAQFPIDQFSLIPEESDGKMDIRTRDILIGPLTIGPGKTLTKQVTLRATRAGTARFHLEMSAKDLTSGNVVKEETTTVSP